MTLSLYILRHAKAEDATDGRKDHERVLRPRGRRAARAVGRFLARIGEVPEKVLCSDAARARETAEVAREAGGWRTALELKPELYGASAGGLLATVQASSPDARRVLLVGHQPALGLLIATLTGAEPDFPTAALARADFELNAWSALRERTGTLRWLVTPELLEPGKD